MTFAETVEDISMVAATGGVVLLFLTLLAALLFTPFAPMEQTYDYTVKMEQVHDTSTVEDAATIQFENLSNEQHAVLFHAFKKNDHFMGESSVTFNSDERYETFDGWKVLDVNGVKMLIAVQESSEKTPAWDKTLADEILLHLFASGLLLSATGLLLGTVASIFTPVRRY